MPYGPKFLCRRTHSIRCRFEDRSGGLFFCSSLRRRWLAPLSFSIFRPECMGSEIVLRRCESILFFSAMMVPLMRRQLSTGFVSTRANTSNLSFISVGEWTGIALRQAWLLGACWVLAYRAVTTFTAPADATNQIFSRTCLSFIRLWRWTVAVIIVKKLGIFLRRAVAS